MTMKITAEETLYSKNESRLTPLGRVIKAQAFKKDMKLKDVAEAAGMSNKTYLSRIMRGDIKNSRYILIIAEMLEINLERYIA